MGDLTPSTVFNGLPVIQSIAAITVSSVRQHKQRSNQRDTYHARVQKKWTKRFGTKSTPAAYNMRDPWTGREILVLHPSIYANLMKIREPKP